MFDVCNYNFITCYHFCVKTANDSIEVVKEEFAEGAEGYIPFLQRLKSVLKTGRNVGICVLPILKTTKEILMNKRISDLCFIYKFRVLFFTEYITSASFCHITRPKLQSCGKDFAHADVYFEDTRPSGGETREFARKTQETV